jgi:hypothetical protein
MFYLSFRRMAYGPARVYICAENTKTMVTRIYPFCVLKSTKQL